MCNIIIFQSVDFLKEVPFMEFKRPQRSQKKKQVKKQHPKLKKFFSVVMVLVAIALVCGTVACTYVYKFANEYVSQL